MHVVAAFENDRHLEIAIERLKEMGIKQDKLCAVPLEQKVQNAYFLDTYSTSDGYSLLDLGFISATVVMLLGTIYGYYLPIGPIFSGLIGLFFGFALGVLIKYMIIKKKHAIKFINNLSVPDVILIVQCDQRDLHDVEMLLWKNHTLAIGSVK